jgi:uncharacterized protein YbjT (DUF2867 family)
MGIDAEPGIMIGRLHRQEERIIEDSGIPYTFLRSTAFMQNFVNFFSNSIRSQGAFYLPAGDAKVGFVDVRDIATLVTRVLTEHDGSRTRDNGKAYDITGPEALSYYQSAEILSNATGKKIMDVNILEVDARQEMKKIGMENWLIDAIMEFYNIIKAGHASQTTTIVSQN